MEFITPEGTVYSGNSFGDIVQRLRQDTKKEASTRKAFMEMISKQCYQHNEAAIRTDSEEHFVQDLVDAGYLIPVES